MHLFVVKFATFCSAELEVSLLLRCDLIWFCWDSPHPGPVVHRHHCLCVTLHTGSRYYLWTIHAGWYINLDTEGGETSFRGRYYFHYEGVSQLVPWLRGPSSTLPSSRHSQPNHISDGFVAKLQSTLMDPKTETN